MADGGPPVPGDRGRACQPVRPLRRGRRFYRAAGRAGCHRDLRVEGTDCGHRPGVGEPGDRADRGAGSGARGDWVKSHFGKFVGILEDFLTMLALDPAFEPARPVLPVYLRQPPDVDQVTLIEDRLTRRVADLFNAVYEVTLQVQSRYFVHHGETPDELETLAKTAKHLMNWVMRNLGPLLTAQPIGPSFPGHTAGPAFEIVRPAFFILPHRESAW